MKNILPFLAGILIALASCVPMTTSRYLSMEDIEYREAASSMNIRPGKALCRQWESYVPDSNHLDHIPMRFVRINFHWMNTSDSIYKPGEFRAKEYTEGLVRAANYMMRKNVKMYLPHGNDTPVLPTLTRVVLTPDPNQPGDDGIYFHYDDEFVHHVHSGKNRTIGERGMYKKYGVNTDSVLNVFILAHDPDSVLSPTFEPQGGGVCLGNFLKIVGIYREYKERDDYWDFRTCLNHEIAHLYGLRHAWIDDGCPDTPTHKQDCYIRSQSAYCDTMTSNNVMDYVAEQFAYTPCQIGRMHSNMSRITNTRRKYLLPTWCELKDSLHIRIQDTIVWNGSKDLEGHLTIEDGGMLTIHCRVSMPPGGKITVAPGAQLILDDAHLHNACDQLWQGIEVQEREGQKGKVVFVGDPKLEDMEHTLK